MSTCTPILALALLLGASFSLAACNTVEGLGRDVQAAGSTLSGTAEKTKEEITQ